MAYNTIGGINRYNYWMGVWGRGKGLVRKKEVKREPIPTDVYRPSFRSGIPIETPYSAPSILIKKEERVSGYDLWKKFEEIARDIMREEGYGNVIYKSKMNEEVVITEEDTKESIRAKIDEIIGRWPYWDLQLEERIDISERAKDILASYLYEKVHGGKISFSELGKKEVPRDREEEGTFFLGQVLNRIRDYGIRMYKKTKELFRIYKETPGLLSSLSSNLATVEYVV
ncbi:MAG: hypothetical protein QME40_01790 [bacterium]|nr:hypothetical protein [bacterium]